VNRSDLLGAVEYNLDWLDKIHYDYVTGLPSYQLVFDCKCIAKIECICKYLNDDGSERKYQIEVKDLLYIRNSKGKPFYFDPYSPTLKEDLENVINQATNRASALFENSLILNKNLCRRIYVQKLIMSHCDCEPRAAKYADGKTQIF
jgi:hypothetical protein